MKKAFKITGIILLSLIVLLGAALGVLTIAEYRPAPTETIIADHQVPALEAGTPLTVVTWNCGYGALGNNADFFMDGGNSVYSSDKERVKQNLAGIETVLAAQGADVLLLQEVDLNSDRSYHIDETAVLRSALDGGSEAFAYNYNSLYVPYPLPPIGHVEGGLYTLSRAEIASAERVSLPCPFSWPVRVVNLKRCLLVSRFPIEGSDRELVVINLHLEAYDSGEGKIAQTRQLVSFMQEEYDKGNYVIAGGDFNQTFSNVETSAYPSYEGMWQPGSIDPADFGEDFSLLMDSSVPTCRSLDRPYEGEEPEDFQFYMIDGFIISANVQVDSMETLDLDFTWTDHNPVWLRCSLLP